jgi:DNA-damage-inducible protein J
MRPQKIVLSLPMMRDTMYLNLYLEAAAMAATTMVHVRVDEEIKAQAAQTLAAMGLTISDAVRVFLTRVVADQELPFALKAPNATSREAIAEARKIIEARQARFSSPEALIDDLEKNRRE